MQRFHSQTLDALVRVQRFLDAHAAGLGTINSSGARVMLDDVVARLSGHAVEQGARTIGSVGETRKQRELRLTIRRKHMRPIAEIAQAKLRDVPQFEDLRLPGEKVRGTRLVAAAGAMAEAATPYATVFAEAGLKTDFAEALRTAAEALRGSLDARADHQRVRKGATIGLAAETARGKRAIKMLDALVEQQAGDAELLKEWRAVKRIPLRPGKPKEAPAEGGVEGQVA